MSFSAARFVGIDLTGSPRRCTAVAVLDASPRLIDQSLLDSDEAILAFAETHRAALVAIDAPLSLPAGLCCLEESCACRPLSSGKGRQCERDLAALGIGCYYTTERSIIKAMVYRAMALRKELVRRCFEVIEVYPYASKRRLLGPLPPKGTRQGRQALQEGLHRLVASVPSPRDVLFSHDLLDAIVAAYTAWLHAIGRTEALGDPQEGLLFIPRI
jgi:predicted nuclease with RNAse H fold